MAEMNRALDKAIEGGMKQEDAARVVMEVGTLFIQQLTEAPDDSQYTDRLLDLALTGLLYESGYLS